MSEDPRRPTGHVFRVERKRGPVRYAKYRLPDGRQVQRKLGLAWTGRGRPAAGHFTKRLAEDWLRDTLDEARRGTLVAPVRTGATFADAAAEWLRYVEHDRDVKPSTLTDYRSVEHAWCGSSAVWRSRRSALAASRSGGLDWALAATGP